MARTSYIRTKMQTPGEHGAGRENHAERRNSNHRRMAGIRYIRTEMQTACEFRVLCEKIAFTAADSQCD